MPAHSFDVEFPLDCDDEFWETGNPETDFKQPVGRPSHTSAPIHHFKLTKIVSVALRTLFGIKKSKEAAGITGNTMDNSISVLDSMLNGWFDSIQSHRVYSIPVLEIVEV